MVMNNSTTRPISDRCEVLGVGISAINLTLAVQTIDHWIAEQHKTYVCVTGVHGVMESQRDPGLKEIHNRAGMVTPDGMPMVWLSHLQGYKHVTQVCGRELMLAVCESSVRNGYRHYFYGGNEGVADLLAEKLQTRFPGLQVVGTCCPPFRPLSEQEDRQIVARINAARPDLLWIGLSTPKQERWMSAHLNRINAPVMLGVGAAFDFHAGLKPSPPRWMQRHGLEWCYRLANEPRRLSARYLINNPMFVTYVLLEQLRLRDFRAVPQ